MRGGVICDVAVEGWMKALEELYLGRPRHHYKRNRNVFSSAAGVRLGEVLSGGESLPRLRVLDLWYCGIGSVGVNVVVKGMVGMSVVEEVFLGKNGNVDVEVLRRMLGEKHAPKLNRIEVDLGLEGFGIVAQGLLESRRLWDVVVEDGREVDSVSRYCIQKTDVLLDWMEKGGEVRGVELRRVMEGKQVRGLEYQAEVGDVVGVEMMMEDGRWCGWDVVRKVVKRNDANILKVLLKHGVDVCEQDEKGWVALHLASQNGHESVCRLLLEAGADVGAREEDDWTSLHLASQNGHKSVCRLLLASGADVGARTKKRSTPLSIAACEGNSSTFNFLLNHGADFSSTTQNGSTILHCACVGGSLSIVQKCIEAGLNHTKHTSTPLSSLNTTDSNHRTPLFLAVEKGNAACVKALVEAGADVGVPGVEGVKDEDDEEEEDEKKEHENKEEEVEMIGVLELARKLGNEEVMKALGIGGEGGSEGDME